MISCLTIRLLLRRRKCTTTTEVTPKLETTTYSDQQQHKYVKVTMACFAIGTSLFVLRNIYVRVSRKLHKLPPGMCAVYI